ncbi:MAG TPA: FG-GAP repeat protein [Blastocatellia bacterium]|nr:FG-GAP repeat protein [Blastocatellia bacterium]
MLGLLDSAAGVAQAQTARQLPALVRAEQTPPDISITGGILQVSGIGDFNGDGVDDFLVKYERSVGDTATIVFFKFGIIFGKRNPAKPIAIDLIADEPDLALTTVRKPPIWYSRLTTLGDLNGDGSDDLVLDQVKPQQPGQPAEALIKVFYGSSKFQPGVVDIDALPPDLTVLSDPLKLANLAVAVAADVNGDGAKDLVLTPSPVPNASWDTAILLGPFAPGATIDLHLQSPDVVIQANDGAGDLLAILNGDFNGDHIADVLLKRRKLVDPIGVFFTNLQIIFGSADWRAGTRVSLRERPADAIIGAGYLYNSTLQVGDITGDGISDILSGEPEYFGEPAPPTWFTGNVNVYFGSAQLAGSISQPDMTIAGLLAPQPFHPVYQVTLGDHLGQSLAVSDLNGDGRPDLLIGAPGATSDNKGRVQYMSRAHIVIGSREIKHGARIETMRTQQDVTISFDARTGGVGRRVASGDFNGDGVRDILVASDTAGYVYFSGPLRAPEIASAKYKAGAAQLTILGTDFTGASRVEINGALIDRAVTFDAEQSRLVLQGTPAELNLVDGKNTLVIIRKGARSNAVKIKMK